MRSFRRLTGLHILCAAGLLFLLTLGVPRALADSINFDLSVPNTAISGYPAPYATVTVDLTDSTHATITFTSLTQDGYTYRMGDGSTVALNVNASSFTAGIQVSGDPDFKQFNYGSQQVDGFGQFNFTIDNTDGFPDAVSSVTFTLTNDGGTWASASDVLVANEGGSTAAAHIFVASADCVDGSGKPVACATGYAANGEQVPEPASIALFGSGLVGLAGLIRRRRK
jgi:hypothetical protein